MLGVFFGAAVLATYGQPLEGDAAAAFAQCQEIVPREGLLAAHHFTWTGELYRMNGSELDCAVVSTAPGQVEFNGVAASIELMMFEHSKGQWVLVNTVQLGSDHYPGAPRHHPDSQWYFTGSRLDPLTDTINIHAVNSSNGPINLEFGRQVLPMLTLGCYQDRTQVYVAFPEKHIAIDDIRVRWRLDGGAIQDEVWRVASDNSTVGHFSGRTAIPLARQLADADELVVSITPFSESNWTMVFDLTGIDSVVEQVRAACSW